MNAIKPNLPPLMLDTKDFWLITGWAIEHSQADDVLKELRQQDQYKDLPLTGRDWKTSVAQLADVLCVIGEELKKRCIPPRGPENAEDEEDEGETLFGESLVCRDLPDADECKRYIIFVVLDDSVPAAKGEEYLITDEDKRLSVTVDGEPKNLREFTRQEVFGKLSEDLKSKISWRTLPHPELMKAWNRHYETRKEQAGKKT